MTDMNNVGPDSGIYKTLLESTRAIPWKIDWPTMNFTYIGPQIEALLGWSVESWVSTEDWAARIHPDDREYVVDYCVSQSKAGVDHEADYRALTKDGDYIWIRDVVHVIRNEDGVEALVGFMFDISEHKETEDELRRLQKELEELSFKDALTCIANRRMFDSIFEREWSSSRRSRESLALILLDIDYFKEYNDHYGHIRGDECLKEIADVLSAAVSRPRDFVARYGGEEFVLVLADTSEETAFEIAEKCRQQVYAQMIPHAASSVSDVVTVSSGVCAVVPEGDARAQDFFRQVDRRLYQAKQSGRNCVVSDGVVRMAPILDEAGGAASIASGMPNSG